MTTKGDFKPYYPTIPRYNVCAGKTKEGSQCNSPANSSGYCYSHRKQAKK